MVSYPFPALLLVFLRISSCFERTYEGWTGTFGWKRSVLKRTGRLLSLVARLLDDGVASASASVNCKMRRICLRICGCVRRFSGDESFLTNPNAFNDDANEKTESRARL